jgi:hypothetical protein
MVISRTRVVSLTLLSLVSAVIASEKNQVDQLIHNLGELPAHFDSNPSFQKVPPMVIPNPVEERRRHLYEELRRLGDKACPAMCNGLADPDLNVRQGVALFLNAVGSTWYTKSKAHKPLVRIPD